MAFILFPTMNSVVAILVSVVEPSSPWVAAFSGSPRLADADTGAEDSHRSEESGTAGAGGRESKGFYPKP